MYEVTYGKIEGLHKKENHYSINNQQRRKTTVSMNLFIKNLPQTYRKQTNV